MSGSIGFKDEEQIWVAASWVYDQIMRLALKHIPGSSPLKLRMIMDTSENPLRYICLNDFSPHELHIFREALKDAYAEAKISDAASFASPEFYSGFMERFEELLAIVMGSTRFDYM